MCRGRNLRHLFKQFDVFSAAAELIVAHQRPERSAAEDAKFLFIDLLEEGALIELQRTLQIPEKVPLGDVQQLDLQHVAGFALQDQMPDSGPRGFQLLEGGIVQNLVQLQRDQAVNLGNARSDCRFRIAAKGHLPFKNLVDELRSEERRVGKECRSRWSP